MLLSLALKHSAGCAHPCGSEPCEPGHLLPDHPLVMHRGLSEVVHLREEPGVLLGDASREGRGQQRALDLLPVFIPNGARVYLERLRSDPQRPTAAVREKVADPIIVAEGTDGIIEREPRVRAHLSSQALRRFSRPRPE